MAFKIRSFSTLGAIVVVAAAAVSPIATAGPTSVPFKATLATQEKLGVMSTCPSFFGGTTTGSGHASHLGALTGFSTDCVAPSTSGTFTFTKGELTLTAANGDELHASYSGTLSPTATPPIYSIAGTYTLTGGTGRFSGANGTGTLQGLENMTTNQGQLQLSGTISY